MIKRVEILIGLLGAALLFLLMGVTFVDVVGRNLLNHPLTGASELTEVLLACIIFLMLPQVALRQQHIVIDLVDSVMGRVGRMILDVVAALFSIAMFSLIAWQLWILGDKAAGYADSTPSLGIPLAPVFYMVAILAGLNVVAFLITIPAIIARKDVVEAKDAKTEETEAERLPFSV
jgi:TRAP-type C4-dicarboxylate transport system permease small subunit